jgi:hypothetical protein
MRIILEPICTRSIPPFTGEADLNALLLAEKHLEIYVLVIFSTPKAADTMVVDTNKSQGLIPHIQLIASLRDRMCRFSFVERFPHWFSTVRFIDDAVLRSVTALLVGVEIKLCYVPGFGRGDSSGPDGLCVGDGPGPPIQIDFHDTDRCAGRPARKRKSPRSLTGSGASGHVAPTGPGQGDRGIGPAGLRRIQAPDSQRNVTSINLRVPHLSTCHDRHCQPRPGSISAGR